MAATRKRKNATDKSAARRAMILPVAVTLWTGATMLGGQVAWMRFAQTQVGSGLLAGAVSLAAAMVGLALGGAVGGRLAQRWRAGALAGTQQALCGASLLLSPLLINAAGSAAAAWCRGRPDPFASAEWALPLAVGAVLALLNIPFGMLLPAAVTLDPGRPGTLGSRVSRRGGIYYALQSGGAVAGAITLGLALPLMMGFNGTLIALAVGHLLLVVWVVLATRPRPAGTPEPPAHADAGSDLPRRPGRRSVMGLAMWLGMLGLASELLWTRALTFYLNSSIYVYGMTTAVFVGALMIGGLVGAWLAPLRRRPGQFLGGVVLMVGLLIALSPQWISGLDSWLTGSMPHYEGGSAELLSGAAGGEFFRQLFTMGIATMVVVGPPTMLMGLAFPLLLRLGAESARSGESAARPAAQPRGWSGRLVGRVSAFNALGSAVGPLLALGVLLSIFDTRRALLAVTIGYMLAALWAEAVDPTTGWHRARRGPGKADADDPRAAKRRDLRARRIQQTRWMQIPWANIVLFMAALGVVLWQRDKDPSIFRQTYLTRIETGTWGATQRVEIDPEAETDTVVLTLTESPEAVVAVRRNTFDGVAELLIDQKVQGDDSAGALRVQRMQGLLPLVLSPQTPRRAVVIGLGTGTSVGPLIQAGVPRIQVAELIEPVIAIAKEQFAAANDYLNMKVVQSLDPLADAPTTQPAGSQPATTNSQLVIRQADGRTLLRLAPERPDLVLVDIVYPTSAGAGGLFSRQFYELAHDRLADGGLLVHWLPLWQIAPGDAASVVAAFLEGFGRDESADLCAWFVLPRPDRPMLALVGCKGKLDLSADRLTQSIARTSAACDRSTSGVTLSMVNLGSPAAVQAGLLTRPLLAKWADDRPVATDGYPVTELNSPLARAPAMGPANARLIRKAGYADPIQTQWLADLLGIKADAGLPEKLAVAIRSRRLAIDAMLESGGSDDPAILARLAGQLDEAVKVDPGNELAAWTLAFMRYGGGIQQARGVAKQIVMLRATGRRGEAEKLTRMTLEELDRIHADFPWDSWALEIRADVLREQGRMDEALVVLDELLRKFPHAIDPLYRKAKLLVELKRWDEADEALNQARARRDDDHIPKPYKQLRAVIGFEAKRTATTQPEGSGE